MSKCLGVFGLSLWTTQWTVEREFSKFGSLEKVVIAKDSRTKRSKGFAFVYFENASDAEVHKFWIWLTLFGDKF